MRVMALGLSVLLAGCQATARQHAAEVNAGLARYRAQSSACYAAVRAEAQYDFIPRKVAFHLSDLPPVTAGQLADPNVPTEAEAAALAAWQRDMAPCQEIDYAATRFAQPAVWDRWREAQAKRDAVFAQLVARQTTWGQANRRINEIRVTWRAGQG